ncbi:hypothetical protein KAT95_03190 [Candidatus Parcubacteria bacterium]|nr:hypothetical protein [Candidatus Parcubacteria bacterium]
MDSKIKILIGVLIIDIVLIGGLWIWSEQKEVGPPENVIQPSDIELITCNEDDDCILVLHYICMCHCDKCAKAMAINKKYLDYWNTYDLSKVKPDCRETVCPMWMPPPGYCTEHCNDNFYRYNAKCRNNKCIAKPANGTLIISTSPKIEYEIGETINIRVENRVGNPVNMGVENGCKGNIYVISKYDEGKWVDFPETCGGCNVDISTSIGTNQVKIFFWNQSVFTNREDCALRSAPLGVYRIKIKYWDADGFKIAYSNEFTIKEKSAIDPLCIKKVKIIGDCDAEVQGYEFNLDTEKCIAVDGSGCSVETPFNSLEECQKVCEKKEADDKYKIYLKSRQFIPGSGISDALKSSLITTSHKQIHVLLQFYHIPNNDERDRNFRI